MHDQFKNEKCAVCGMKFFDDEEIVVCPECGTPTNGNKFCGNCGKKLG